MSQRRRPIAVLVFGGFVALGAVRCSIDPCANTPGVEAVGLDLSGASNTACTLLVTDGNKTLTYDIPAPSPPVADTSLDSRRPPTGCLVSVDAGIPFDGGTRSSTVLCFAGDSALDALAHSTQNDGCPLTLSLSCAGLTFYDNVKWYFCGAMC